MDSYFPARDLLTAVTIYQTPAHCDWDWNQESTSFHLRQFHMRSVTPHMPKGVDDDCCFCTLYGYTLGLFPFAIHATRSIVNFPPQRSRSTLFIGGSFTLQQIVLYCHQARLKKTTKSPFADLFQQFDCRRPINNVTATYWKYYLPRESLTANSWRGQ